MPQHGAQLFRSLLCTITNQPNKSLISSDFVIRRGNLACGRMSSSVAKSPTAHYQSSVWLAGPRNQVYSMHSMDRLDVFLTD